MAEPRSTRVAFWAAFSQLLTIAIFAQSFFAGVFLSGEVWGRDAHRVNAMIVVTVTLIAGIVALITMRNISYGKRLAASLLGLGVALLRAHARSFQHGDEHVFQRIHAPLGLELGPEQLLAELLDADILAVYGLEDRVGLAGAPGIAVPEGGPGSVQGPPEAGADGQGSAPSGLQGGAGDQGGRR